MCHLSLRQQPLGFVCGLSRHPLHPEGKKTQTSASTNPLHPTTSAIQLSFDTGALAHWSKHPPHPHSSNVLMNIHQSPAQRPEGRLISWTAGIGHFILSATLGSFGSGLAYFFFFPFSLFAASQPDSVFSVVCAVVLVRCQLGGAFCFHATNV